MSNGPINISGQDLFAFIQWGYQDPSVVPTTGPIGSFFIRTADSPAIASAAGWYMKVLTGGKDTNWVKVMGGPDTIGVEDEGLPLGSFSTLNFVGAGVTATDGGGGTAIITIPGGGAGFVAARQPYVIAAPDIANGYLDLPDLAVNPTVNPIMQGAGPLVGGAIASGDDYEMSVVLGITRVTFDPAVVALWVVGQRIQIQYWH